MTATWSRQHALPVDSGRTTTPPPPLFGIIRNLAICVAVQLGLTIAVPDQDWSMPMGMVGLCLICAFTTVQLGRSSAHPDRFATNAVTGFFIIWAIMWATLIYEDRMHDEEQLVSCVLGFVRQLLLIVFLVPRGAYRGQRWPVVLDAVLGIVMCGVLCTTLWPQLLTGRLAPTDDLQSFLGHGYSIFATLAVGSYLVQRRSPPMFLKALAMTLSVYAITSILSVIFSVHLGWPDNSPFWIYGDCALIAYPLMANHTMRRQAVSPAPIGLNVTPNHVVPFMIAILVLCLAFGSAYRQQMLVAVVGVAGLFVYSFRVAFVTHQYRTAQDALVASERMRVESLIDVVHELRSPLASVVLNASALARATDIPARLKPRVDTIANRCGTVTRLLNDVLDLERIEAGLMDITMAPVDVAIACRSAIDAVRVTADAAGVALRGPDERAPSFHTEGDAGLLCRVIVNLLDNAIRFTPAGGAVSLSIGHVDPSWVAVIVEDTGIGVSAGARATLFKRFGHAADPVNGTKGSGLGLSISSSAIEAMQGQLSLVARDPEPGTRATILLKRLERP